MTEGRNTGFKKILDALDANGSPKPEFETDEDRSYFITRLFIHERFQVDNGNFAQKNERSLSEVLSEVLPLREYKRVERIVLYLEEKGEITSREAENICNKAPATVRRYLKILEKTGYVEQHGKTNNASYKVSDKDIE